MRMRLGRVLCLAVLGFAGDAFAMENARPMVEAAIQADGSVLFEGVRFEGDILELKITELASRRPTPVLRLTANKDAEYQTIAAFLEALQKAGLQINMTGVDNAVPK